MRITRAGTQPSQKGPADWFTGTVRIDPLFSANDPARAAGAQVTFEPCSRTDWHTHPLGQVLIVTSGVDPGVGDITYYAPWGNLAIFDRDFGYSRGLVRLGRLDSGVESLRGHGPVRVTIERAER